MKKILSLLLCLATLLGLLVGCQQERTSESALPFETYGAYKILNVTPESLDATAGGSKASFYDALATTTAPAPVGSSQTKWSFGNDTYKIHFKESKHAPIGDSYYNFYSFSAESEDSSDAMLELTPDGKLRALYYPPIKLPDVAKMSDDELRLMLEAMFAECFDFSKYTEFSMSRSSATTAQITWSRCKGEYTLGDSLFINISLGELIVVFTGTTVDLPPDFSVPTFDELRPEITEYLNDYFEGTGKNLVSFELHEGILTRFEGSYALDLRISTRWKNSGADNECVEGVFVIILLE